MAFDAHKNLGYSTVAVAPSPAGSGTSLTVATGEGGNFPTPPFNATVWPGNDIPKPSNAEIVRVTNIVGDVLTITRTQESTSARSILVGDQIANTATAKTFTDIETLLATFTGTGAIVRDTTPLFQSYTDYTGMTSPATPGAGVSRLYSQLGVDGVARMSVKSPAGFDLTIFRDSVQRVFNPTGSTITKGSAVRIIGQNSGTPSINASKADSTTTDDVFGILIADALAGGFSTVQYHGLAQNIDTSAFNLGDNLYLSDTTAGALTATPPTKPSVIVPIGTVMVKNATTGQIFLNIENSTDLALDNLTDVSLTSPAVNDILAFNGANWVNSPPFSAGASPGILFYNATPVINSRTQPSGLTQDGTAGNGIQLATLSKTPVTTAEQTSAGLANNNTVAFAAWLYGTALGRTVIDAGVWTFNTWCGINAGGSTSTLTRQIYQVQVPSSGTVTVTGALANTRTVTASAGTPFAATGFFAASATNTTASYIQLPSGIYQISARTSDTVVTIIVPTGYSNEGPVAYTVWNKLFGATSAPITAITPAYALTTFTTTQSSFAIASTDELGAISFFTTAAASKTITLTYNGTAHNTSFETPLITLHNNLAGLQGGTSNQYYHLTSNEYQGTGVGTGNMARLNSPQFTTPNIGSATGDVSGNAGSASAVKSATTTIDLVSATAPSTGQVLTATDSTHATWQPAGGGDILGGQVFT